MLGWVVTESAGFTSAFHAEFPLQDADLASVGLKATGDKIGASLSTIVKLRGSR